MIRRKILFAIATTALLAIYGSALAETTDFGGHTERYKGGGDKIPPQCQISIPKSATEPFWITWNCIDDNAGAQDIRTELWLFRKDSAASELVGTFLGFPAGSRIEAQTLHAETIANGLPARFRLLARDRSGNSAISPTLLVGTEDWSFASCDLTVTRAATASSGDTTGTPAQSVSATAAAVEVDLVSSSQISIATAQPAVATACEIESICTDGENVALQSTLSVTDDTVSGTLTVNSTAFSVTGTATSSADVIQQLEVSGTTTIDDSATSLTLKCKQ